MKKKGTVDYAENSINSLILVTKLKGNEIFSILKILKKIIQWKKNGTVDFTENSINSLILITKLKGNQNFSILSILKIVFKEK